jgi:hypothetical protein
MRTETADPSFAVSVDGDLESQRDVSSCGWHPSQKRDQITERAATARDTARASCFASANHVMKLPHGLRQSIKPFTKNATEKAIAQHQFALWTA